MQESIEKTWRINEFTLSGKVWNESCPTRLLALHGWLDNANSFDKLAPLLSQHETLVLDLPGHGQSDHFRNPDYSIWNYLVPLLRLHNHLDDKPTFLLGHSMGAGVSMLLGATYPENFKGLIWLDAIGSYINRDSSIVDRLKKAVQVRLEGTTWEPYIINDLEQAALMRYNGASLPLEKETAKHLVPRSLKETLSGLEWSFDPALKGPNLSLFAKSQYHEILSKIPLPILNVMAQEGIYREQHSNILDLLQNSRNHTLPGKHHFHMEGMEAQIATLINTFVAEVS